MRQHQFHKVEMVKVTAPEDSAAAHEAMTAHAEELLQLLADPSADVRAAAPVF